MYDSNTQECHTLGTRKFVIMTLIVFTFKIIFICHGAVGSHVTAPGEQLGVELLSRGIEGGYSPYQQSLPDLSFEPTTFRLQVRLAIH